MFASVHSCRARWLSRRATKLRAPRTPQHPTAKILNKPRCILILIRNLLGETCEHRRGCGALTGNSCRRSSPPDASAHVRPGQAASVGPRYALSGGSHAYPRRTVECETRSYPEADI